MNTISNYLVLVSSPFQQLLDVLSLNLNSNLGSGVALVVDDNKKLLGVVEDSDLRKSLNLSKNEDLRIIDVMRKDFIYVESSMNKNEVIESLFEQINLRGWHTNLPVKIIPVVKDGVPVALLNLEELQLAISLKRDRFIVVGLGYVGLTLALTFAQLGRQVWGVDSAIHKLKMLESGTSYITEPGIEQILIKSIQNNFFVQKNLTNLFSAEGIRNIFFICVGTPLTPDCKPDLSAIDEIVTEILKTMKVGDSIVMRSTVPVGTGRKIVNRIQIELGWIVGSDFHYISAPERTAEGNALKEIRDLPQLIAGATEDCLMYGLGIFQKVSSSIIQLDTIESAELVKIMGNAFRDYIFGFSNFLIDICQQNNLDINLLIEASNQGYPRSAIPAPSPGVGGPCLTKDPYFLSGNDFKSAESPIILSRKVNLSTPTKVLNFILSKEEVGDLKTHDLLAIGIAFKGVPETNDIRNSTAIDFISGISESTKSISIWDSTVDLSTIDIGVNFSSYESNKSYSFLAILNNNPRNLDFCRSVVKNLDVPEIILYDPWRMIEPLNLNISKKVNRIHYFSLSHYNNFII
jgi:UDP-N-acetyl-D-mannosaminuronic acid dehydrogenase